MADVSVAFAVGSEQVTVVLPVDLPTDGETIITGDFGGLVAAGTTARLRGNVNLTGNMHVRGTLLCDPSGVNLNGNGFDIHTHDGIINLQGVEKSAWVRWGDPVIGWQIGDRLAIAPTKQGVYWGVGQTPPPPLEMTWTGSWTSMIRPANSPTVTLLDGRMIEPEVVNLAQTVVLRNLQRIMFHEATVPAVQTLKWIRVLDSGEAGVLGMYSVHFHMLGEMVRGSLIEGVVAEGSKNHSFVPHASHGVTFRDCVAYKAAPGAFWWDPPPQALPGTPEDQAKRSPINNSNDTTWEHCGVLYVLGGTSITAEGFSLGAGHGNKLLDSFAACVKGGKNASGVHWPGHASQNDGGNVWEVANIVIHNNRNVAVFIWQNGGSPFAPDHHINDDIVIYNIGDSGWEHGAYANSYEQRGMVIQKVGAHAIVLWAIGGIIHTDVITDDSVLVTSHSIPTTAWIPFTRCVFTRVIYNTNEDEEQPSFLRFVDCHKPDGSPLVPADFVSWLTVNGPTTPIALQMGGMHPLSEVEILEGGVLTHRWAGGTWS